MHRTKKKKQGAHVLNSANVTTNPCLLWPHYISYVIEIHKKCYGPYAYFSLDKGIAYARGGLGTEANFGPPR